MSHSLNSLKGGFIGDSLGGYYRHYKGDTRSLDYTSNNDMPQKLRGSLQSYEVEAFG